MIGGLAGETRVRNMACAVRPGQDRDLSTISIVGVNESVSSNPPHNHGTYCEVDVCVIRDSRPSSIGDGGSAHVSRPLMGKEWIATRAWFRRPKGSVLCRGGPAYWCLGDLIGTAMGAMAACRQKPQ